MFLLSCLVPDIGVVDHVNIFVPTCVHFGVFGVVLPPSLSHSGLFICDMHFGITHLVPHHCTPALIVLWGIHTITVEESLPFSGLAVSLDAFTP